MRIATGEITENVPTPESEGKDPAAVALGRKGGMARAAFQPAIAEELISKLSPGKPIRLRTVGRDSDQKVADEYGRYLQSRGFQIAEHHITTYAIPEPKHPITIRDEGSMIDLTVAPSTR